MIMITFDDCYFTQCCMAPCQSIANWFLFAFFSLSLASFLSSIPGALELVVFPVRPSSVKVSNMTRSYSLAFPKQTGPPLSWLDEAGRDTGGQFFKRRHSLHHVTVQQTTSQNTLSCALSQLKGYADVQNTCSACFIYFFFKLSLEFTWIVEEDCLTRNIRTRCAWKPHGQQSVLWLVWRRIVFPVRETQSHNHNLIDCCERDALAF